MDKNVAQETNVFKRAWIRFWYNGWTRIFVVLAPTYFIILVPLLHVLNVCGEATRIILQVVYIGVLAWAIIDNDFTNLYRIGRNVHGKRL